ncbi:hypothetical protein HanPI659440_Chr15g0603881 [Helianthus annuus]|nr:hypothetical protein HanPI659440_Chr15g0603881 [Helianthus annuus]
MESFPILSPIYKFFLLIGCFKRIVKKRALFYVHHQTSKYKDRYEIFTSLLMFLDIIMDFYLCLVIHLLLFFQFIHSIINPNRYF